MLAGPISARIRKASVGLCTGESIVPKLKSIRRRHRIRRDAHPTSGLHHNEKKIVNDNREEAVTTEEIPMGRILTQAEDRKEIQPENAIDRQQIFKVLDEAMKMEAKKEPEPEETFSLDKISSEEDSAEEGFKEWLKKRGGIKPKKIPRVKKLPEPPAPLVGMANPRAVKPGKHTLLLPHRGVTTNLGRLDKKLSNIRKLLGGKENNAISELDTGIRVRRKTEADRSANKIAKMFLTLSAMNGYHDRRKAKCKDDDYDDEEDDWDDDGDGKSIQMKRTPSSNEERYKVKKWIEYLKSRRSNRYCPCNGNDDDGFPLENKVGKAPLMIDGEHSGEESEEMGESRRERPFLQRYGYYPRGRGGKDNRYKYPKISGDIDEKLKALRERGRKKLELPLEDLELYRSRAKKILQNAEDILDKIKEEEDKRLSKPEYLANHIKELTSRIQSNPRNNENNEFMRILQKSLGFDALHKVHDEDGDNGTPDASLTDTIKAYFTDPYEKARELTEESAKQLSSYMLRNLAKLGEAEDKVKQELKGVDKSTQTGEEMPPNSERLVSNNQHKEGVDETDKESPRDSDGMKNNPKNDKTSNSEKQNSTETDADVENLLKKIIQDLLKDQREQGHQRGDKNLQKTQHTYDTPKKPLFPIRPIADKKKEMAEKIKKGLSRLPLRRKYDGRSRPDYEYDGRSRPDYEYDYYEDNDDGPSRDKSKKLRPTYGRHSGKGLNKGPKMKDSYEYEYDDNSHYDWKTQGTHRQPGKDYIDKHGNFPYKTQNIPAWGGSQEQKGRQLEGEAELAQESKSTENFQPMISNNFGRGPNGKTQRPKIQDVDRLVKKIMADLKDVSKGNEASGKDVDRIVGKLMSDLKGETSGPVSVDDVTDAIRGNVNKALEYGEGSLTTVQGMNKVEGMTKTKGQDDVDKGMSGHSLAGPRWTAVNNDVIGKILRQLEGTAAGLKSDVGNDIQMIMGKLVQDLKEVSDREGTADENVRNLVGHVIGKLQEATPRVGEHGRDNAYRIIGNIMADLNAQSATAPDGTGDKNGLDGTTVQWESKEGKDSGIVVGKPVQNLQGVLPNEEDSTTAVDTTIGQVINKLKDADKKIDLDGGKNAPDIIRKIIDDLKNAKGKSEIEMTGKLKEAIKAITLEDGKNAKEVIGKLMQELKESDTNPDRQSKSADGAVKQIIEKLAYASKGLKGEGKNPHLIIGNLMSDLKDVTKGQSGGKSVDDMVGKIMGKLKDAKAGVQEDGGKGAHGIIEQIIQQLNDINERSQSFGREGDPKVGQILGHLGDATLPAAQRSNDVNEILGKIMTDPRYSGNGVEAIDKEAVRKIIGQLDDATKRMTNRGDKNAHKVIGKLIHDLKDVIKGRDTNDEALDKMVGQVLEKLKDATEGVETGGGDEAHKIIGKIIADLKSATKEEGATISTGELQNPYSEMKLVDSGKDTGGRMMQEVKGIEMKGGTSDLEGDAVASEIMKILPDNGGTTEKNWGESSPAIDMDRVVGRIMAEKLNSEEIEENFGHRLPKNKDGAETMVKILTDGRESYDGLDGNEIPLSEKDLERVAEQMTPKYKVTDIDDADDAVSIFGNKENLVGQTGPKLADEYDGPIVDYSKTSADEDMDRVVGRIIGDLKNIHTEPDLIVAKTNAEENEIDSLSDRATGSTEGLQKLTSTETNYPDEMTQRRQGTADSLESELIDGPSQQMMDKSQGAYAPTIGAYDNSETETVEYSHQDTPTFSESEKDVNDILPLGTDTQEDEMMTGGPKSSIFDTNKDIEEDDNVLKSTQDIISSLGNEENENLQSEENVQTAHKKEDETIADYDNLMVAMGKHSDTTEEYEKSIQQNDEKGSPDIGGNEVNQVIETPLDESQEGTSRDKTQRVGKPRDLEYDNDLLVSEKISEKSETDELLENYNPTLHTTDGYDTSKVYVKETNGKPQNSATLLSKDAESVADSSELERVANVLGKDLRETLDGNDEEVQALNEEKKYLFASLNGEDTAYGYGTERATSQEDAKDSDNERVEKMLDENTETSVNNELTYKSDERFSGNEEEVAITRSEGKNEKTIDGEEEYETTDEPELVATPRNGMYDMDGNYITSEGDDEGNSSSEILTSKQGKTPTEDDKIKIDDIDFNAEVNKMRNIMDEEGLTSTEHGLFTTNGKYLNSNEDERVQMPEESDLTTTEVISGEMDTMGESREYSSALPKPKKENIEKMRPESDNLKKEPSSEKDGELQAYHVDGTVTKQWPSTPTDDEQVAASERLAEVEDDVNPHLQAMKIQDHNNLHEKTMVDSTEEENIVRSDVIPADEKVEMVNEELEEAFSETGTYDRTIDSVERTGRIMEDADMVKTGGISVEKQYVINSDDESVGLMQGEVNNESTEDERVLKTFNEESTTESLDDGSYETLTERQLIQEEENEPTVINSYDPITSTEDMENVMDEELGVTESLQSKHHNEIGGILGEEQKPEENERITAEHDESAENIDQELASMQKIMDEAESTATTEKELQSEEVTSAENEKVAQVGPKTLSSENEMNNDRNELNLGNREYKNVEEEERLGTALQDSNERDETDGVNEKNELVREMSNSGERVAAKLDDDVDNEINPLEIRRMSDESEEVASAKVNNEDENDVNQKSDSLKQTTEWKQKTSSSEIYGEDEDVNHENEENNESATVRMANKKPEKEKTTELWDDSPGQAEPSREETVQKIFKDIEGLVEKESSDEVESLDDSKRVSSTNIESFDAENNKDIPESIVNDIETPEVVELENYKSAENNVNSEETTKPFDNEEQEQETNLNDGDVVGVGEDIDNKENDVLASKHLTSNKEVPKQSYSTATETTDNATSKEDRIDSFIGRYKPTETIPENWSNEIDEGIRDGLEDHVQKHHSLDDSMLDMTTEGQQEVSEDETNDNDLMHFIGDRQSEPMNMDKLTTYDRGTEIVEKGQTGDETDLGQDWAINSTDEGEIEKALERIINAEKGQPINPEQLTGGTPTTEQAAGQSSDDLTRLRQMMATDRVTSDPNDWKIQTVDNENTSIGYDEPDLKVSGPNTEPLDQDVKTGSNWVAHPYEDDTLRMYDDPLLGNQNVASDYDLLDNSKEIYAPLQPVKNKMLGSFDDNTLQDVENKLMSPKGKLTMPKGIQEIMKDLSDGKVKDDISSLQSLDPDKIDRFIGRIDEAETENQNDDVDCKKECACADEIESRSKKIGRYEIVKDFLHWVKDLRMNRVLSDD
ncbi:hypothetical protein RUM44_002168 [Polyplax serrata]|uniref:Uncharacterized protein n=1 Tax=Polyplax serrata TaxID=468196 RepID=A0ABR1AMS5_POLSC